MHKAELLSEEKTQKILRNFEMQTDHLITARRLDSVKVFKKVKKTSRIVDFDIPMIHWVKFKENEMRDKYLDFDRLRDAF